MTEKICSEGRDHSYSCCPEHGTHKMRSLGGHTRGCPERVVDDVAHLLWCANEGYLLAEDRAILTGPTIFESPDDMLHPDNLEEKPGWLSMARDLIDIVRTPILIDAMAQIEALATRGVGARVIDGELVTYALVERDEVLALFNGGPK